MTPNMRMRAEIFDLVSHSKRRQSHGNRRHAETLLLLCITHAARRHNGTEKMRSGIFNLLSKGFGSICKKDALSRTSHHILDADGLCLLPCEI